MSVFVETRDTASSAWVRRDAAIDTLTVTDAVNEPSTLNVTLIDPTGAAHFARGQGIKLTIENPDDITYWLDLPGTAENYATGTDAPQQRVTGDLDLRALVKLDAFATGGIMVLISKWSGGNAYRFEVSASGGLTLGLHDGTTARTAGVVAPTGLDGAEVWLRATWRQSDGKVQFFTSLDGTKWVKTGADGMIAAASINAATDDLKIGTWFAGSARMLDGEVYRALVLDGIDGTTVADFFPNDGAGALAWNSAATGEAWTVNTSGVTPATIESSIGTTDAFTGFIDTSSEGRLGLGGVRRHNLSCVDQHYLAMKRVTARAYQNQTAGSIVRDLINEPDEGSEDDEGDTGNLFAEGVTGGIIEDGPVIREITFNYVTFAHALADLAERAGFWWRIGPDLTLDFATPLTILGVLAGSEDINAGAESVLAGAESGDGAPIDLAALALADTISVQRHAHTYRNRQWVRGGRDRTTPQTEVQTGDGERRAFVLGFPVASTPTIEVSRDGAAFAAESVGIGGIDTDKAWLWNEGTNSVSQASSGTILAAADRVRVIYTGFFDVIVRVEDEPKRLARAGVEGGTGLIENVLVDGTSDSQNASLQLAGELLEYYGREAVVIRFATESRAFQPGQRRAVSLAEADVSVFDALVTTVEWFTTSARLRAVVTLVAGPLDGSWAQWLGALSRRIDKASDKRGREVEIVTTLEQFSKDWTEAERPNIFVEFFPGSGLFPGSTPVASFRSEDRVLFVEWWNAGAPLGRKEFTTQTGADEMVTSTVLTATDAVGDIAELVWYGGMRATASPGTGVEVAREAFVKTKTDIEQIIVERTDRRWA